MEHIKVKGIHVNSHWGIRHNVIVDRWTGLGASITRNERAILELAHGIDQWVGVHGADGYSRPNIVQPLFDAFGDALNFDLGGLDGGTLSSWAHERVRSLGLDSDTYEFVAATEHLYCDHCVKMVVWDAENEAWLPYSTQGEQGCALNADGHYHSDDDA